jgi:hypothetical protein
MITAKPVLDQNYWILTQGDAKIGAITADAAGYTVTIRGRRQRFADMRRLQTGLKIDLPAVPRIPRSDHAQVHGYDTGCRVHNGMWHVQLRIPVFTKSTKSRSWYAAGWYAVQQARSWKIGRNPKLILLQRYRFQGPFQDRDTVQQQVTS